VAVFDHPVEHTILMPDYTTLEIQVNWTSLDPTLTLPRV
jgi:hypothetical protein